MRIACCLLLLSAPSAGAWAATAATEQAATATGRGACVYTPAAHASNLETRPENLPAPLLPARAPRITSNASVPVVASPATTRGGGSDGDDMPIPRLRAPRWHSFLPGMFR